MIVHLLSHFDFGDFVRPLIGEEQLDGGHGGRVEMRRTSEPSRDAQPPAAHLVEDLHSLEGNVTGARVLD